MNRNINRKKNGRGTMENIHKAWSVVDMASTGSVRNTVRILAVFLLLTFLITGCGKTGQSGQKTDEAENGEKLKVVTTLFPYYDFTRQIAGDHVELSMVIPAGMDSHSFEPTPADIRMIQNADLLVCNGGAMEHWVEQVLSSLGEEKPAVLTMMDYVGVVEEELVEGMEDSGDGHDHSHDHGAEAEDHGHSLHNHEDESQFEIEYDEHIWTSPVNAMKIVGEIAGELEQLDPENAEVYEENAAEYLENLKSLDEEFRQIVKEGKRDVLIIGDKFPLRYFADEYGLRYRAAFSGCSSDTEPSAKTIAYLIDKVREEEILAVYYLELSSRRVSEIIGEETGAEPLLFHSCHNVTRREFDGGVTYMELMEKNAENLQKGLSE